MTKEEILFYEIGKELPGSQQSQMFGKPCFKINGKAFISFFNNDMVFKISGEQHSKALSLAGSKQFDPSGKNRPMKEWVQIPAELSKKWKEFAKPALEYVQSINQEK